MRGTMTYPKKEQNGDQAQWIYRLLQGQLGSFRPDAIIVLKRILLEELHDDVSERDTSAKRGLVENGKELRKDASLLSKASMQRGCSDHHGPCGQRVR